MSIADKLSRLVTARNNCILSFIQRGVSASGHGFEDFPADILNVHDNLLTKSISGNGIYSASTDSCDGYSSVSVDVCPGRLPIYYKDLGPHQYVYTNGTFKLNGTTVSYSDVYLIQANVKYILTLGSDVGTRFRSIITSEDTTTTTVDLQGTSVIYKNNPSPFDFVSFISSIDGYLTVTKDNAGKANIPTYVFDYNALISGLCEWNI